MRITHQVTLMLLLVTWYGSTRCLGITVDPPEHLVISDPGHLGHLQIRWSPPASLMNNTECSKLYQLEYFDTNTNSWDAIRTPRTEYSAQFDLMKDVSVRVYTVLNGPCTNGTMIKSRDYAALVQKPSSTGVKGTAVRDFVCVYYNRQHLKCKWGENPKMSAKSRQNLYFWHKGLEKADECPKYLISNGVRSGCDFTGKALPEFSEINFCVNGSSPEGPLMTTFISLQILNHVKPETTTKVNLQTGPGKRLEIQWESPAGNIPVHCLEWEVEHEQDGPDGKIATQQITTKEMSLTLTFDRDDRRNCFRVRSKLHKYCANKSLWSEWSRPTCHPEKKEAAPEPGWDVVAISVCIAVAIIAIMVLSLCVWAVRISRREKKPDSLLTLLFARPSALQFTSEGLKRPKNLQDSQTQPLSNV
uniref:Interleukin 13 receptor, alpha 2 n=1 Tax=Gasterosteus aculeatus aculeatus TaxID=481459 RepID=G3QBW4_GASAC|nr:interleukin-13 receptor subunit alpha-2 isoform X1 [Gasterosteus aculeatus aculeatus]